MSAGTEFHLAQANVALAAARLDSPTLADMIARIGEINALAERSPGFVWRFQNPSGSNWLAPFTDYFQPFEPERIFFNMSVWRSVEDLSGYVFGTAHADLWRKRKTWMLPPVRPHLALWWISAGRQPKVTEARNCLSRLERDGPTRAAFEFKRPFPPPGEFAAPVSR